MQVEVFSQKAPERPFVEVYMIESQQQSGWSLDGQSEIVAAMREKAGRLGCDGLLLTGSNDATRVTGGNGSVSSHTLKGYRGVCIVYRDAPDTAVTP